MKLLFVGDNKKAEFRFRTICAQINFDFQSVMTGYDALNKIQLAHYHFIVVCDKQPLINAPDLTQKIIAQGKPIVLFVYVENYSITHLYKFLAAGNDRWLLKSFTDEEIANQLQVADSQPMNYIEIDRSRFLLEKKFDINNLIGSSPAMTDLYRDIERTSGTEISVLIQGASGSGKELVARLLHLSSHRRNNRFVGLNCAAIPKDLMESELFGFEKGAFTGAAAAKVGKFQYADQGTLFLDEIADMDILLQSKILRVIEQKEYERIGSNETLKSDVRIISASNKNLAEEIDSGRFRLDLLYRINSLTLNLPPLQQRPDDFLPLLVYFVHRHNKKSKRKIEWFENNILSLFKKYPWTGNIREFDNVLARSLLFNDGDILTEATIIKTMGLTNRKPDDLPEEKTNPATKITPMIEVEKQAILNALRLTGGNSTQAAKQLGLSRVTIWRKIEKYNLKNSINEIN